MQNQDNKLRESQKTALLREIAKLYYLDDLNQQEIAQKLELSRSSIARYLIEAKNRGIVQIHISNPDESYRVPFLEKALKSKYKLLDCVVAVSKLPNNYNHSAAEFITSTLPPSGIVAIGGGTTLFSIGQNLKMTNRIDGSKLTFIQSTGIVNEAVPSTAVVQTWAMKFGATPVYMSYPGIMLNKEAKRLMQVDAEFTDKYRIMKRADACIFGIGTVSQFQKASVNFNAVINEVDSTSSEAIGDICFHLFNQNGDFCCPEFSEHVCGLSTVDFLRIPTRIAGAFGIEKVESIRAAIMGRLANVLLTDDTTAKLLLEDSSTEENDT